jgi:predicted DsbA family dithiol-disulfide isomerase
MRTTQWISTLTNVVLVLCAVVVTGLVVRREFFRSPGAAASAAPEPVTVVDDWRGYAAEGHRWGPDAAPVSLVVFSDYQCPACRRLAEDLKAIRADFPEQVAVVIRHIPIASHPFALPAARASECAARQERFIAFHHALFAGQALIGVDPWTRFAQDARLPDLPAFDACMAETGPVAAVERDRAAGRRLEVDRTPTLLINEHRYAGAPPLSTLRERVQRAVEQASRTARAAAATSR